MSWAQFATAANIVHCALYIVCAVASKSMSWAVWSVQCRLAGAGWRDHWPGGTCGHMVQCHQQWPPDHNIGTMPSHQTNTTTNTTLGMGAFVAVSVNS